MRAHLVLISLCGGLVTPLAAQSMNVDIGTNGTAPASTYAAAGLPGYWNSLTAMDGSTAFNLRDLAGNVTNVSMWQGGGTELRNTNDPATLGDDGLLMDDCQVTYTSTEVCVFFYGLQNGTYDVIVYAMMPAQPTVLSRTHSDDEPGQPYVTVGGPWPGHQ